MSIQQQLTEDLKTAMRAKDGVTLEALRAIKSALLLARTESGSQGSVTEEQEVRMLQKLVKQRQDSADIYKKQGREGLAETEMAQAAVIEKYLPEQLGEEEITKAVMAVIEKTGASGMQDMGKVMGAVTKELAGKADGKTIAAIVKQKLSL